MGKSVSMGPIKPNEPLKKGAEPKKSFLCNTGKALQSTPMRQAFTPRPVNVGALIYNDADAESDEAINFEEIEFTRPAYKYGKRCLMIYFLDIILSTSALHIHHILCNVTSN